MSDLISRQAAIDYIDAGRLCNPNEPRWSDNEIVNFLKSRPTAQPEIKCIAKITMTDEQVKEAFEKAKKAKCEILAVQTERKKGKWIADNHDFWVCSNCKFPSEAHGANILYKFCPNCGADMRGEQDE